MGTIRINYSTFALKGANRKGAIVVLMYSGSGDPKVELDNVVRKITEGIGYFELIDAHLDNPWMRVVMTNINEMTPVQALNFVVKLQELTQEAATS